MGVLLLTMAPPDVTLTYLAYRHAAALVEEWMGYMLLTYLWSGGMWLLMLVALPHCIVFARHSHAALGLLSERCGFPPEPHRKCPFLALPWNNWFNAVVHAKKTK